MERINQLLAQRKDNRSLQERQRVAQETINSVVAAIFADLPDVNVMAIEGEIPGFNDGDPCYWSQWAMVDWLNYGYGGDRPNVDMSLMTRDPKSLPDYQQRKELPEYNNLFAATQLLDTLKGECELIAGDYGGRWWVFTRDASAEGGFRMETQEFENY